MGCISKALSKSELKMPVTPLDMINVSGVWP